MGDVLTFGAGEQFQAIYDLAFRNNVRFVGGTGMTVGAAGGWITGGGHGILSNELGTPLPRITRCTLSQKIMLIVKVLVSTMWTRFARFFQMEHTLLPLAVKIGTSSLPFAVAAAVPLAWSWR